LRRHKNKCKNNEKPRRKRPENALGGVGVWCSFGVYCGVLTRFSAQHSARAKADKRRNIKEKAAYRFVVKRYAALAERAAAQ